MAYTLVTGEYSFSKLISKTSVCASHHWFEVMAVQNTFYTRSQS